MATKQRKYRKDLGMWGVTALIVGFGIPIGYTLTGHAMITGIFFPIIAISLASSFVLMVQPWVSYSEPRPHIPTETEQLTTAVKELTEELKEQKGESNVKD